jgi:hypothetical protein
MTRQEVHERFLAIVTRVDQRRAKRTPQEIAADTPNDVYRDGRRNPVKPEYGGDVMTPGNQDGRKNGGVL